MCSIPEKVILSDRLGGSLSNIFGGKLGKKRVAIKKVSVVDSEAFETDFNALTKLSHDNVARWIT